MFDRDDLLCGPRPEPEEAAEGVGTGRGCGPWTRAQGEVAWCAVPFLVALTVTFPVPRRPSPWRRRVSGPPLAAGQHTHAFWGAVIHTARTRRAAGPGFEK